MRVNRLVWRTPSFPRLHSTCFVQKKPHCVLHTNGRPGPPIPSEVLRSNSPFHPIILVSFHLLSAHYIPACEHVKGETWHQSTRFKPVDLHFLQILIIFTHLKLWIASARHNFKWWKFQLNNLGVKGLMNAFFIPRDVHGPTSTHVHRAHVWLKTTFIIFWFYTQD